MATPMPRDWLAKTSAGILLGLALALACSVVFARLAVGLAPPIRAQLAMWMVIPVWFSILSSSFFFATGKRAWLALGVATSIVVGAALAARLL